MKSNAKQLNLSMVLFYCDWHSPLRHWQMSIQATYLYLISILQPASPWKQRQLIAVPTAAKWHGHQLPLHDTAYNNLIHIYNTYSILGIFQLEKIIFAEFFFAKLWDLMNVFLIFASHTLLKTELFFERNTWPN